MTEVKKVFVDQNEEALNCPEIRVQHYLSKRAELGSAVPPVRAVDENVLTLLENLFNYQICSL